MKLEVTIHGYRFDDARAGVVISIVSATAESKIAFGSIDCSSEGRIRPQGKLRIRGQTVIAKALGHSRIIDDSLS